MRLVLVLASLLLLAACAAEDTEKLQQQAQQGWQDLAMERLVAHEEAIVADKKAPLQHRQLARAVLRMVSDCAIERRTGRTWKVAEAMAMDFAHEETSCAKRVINQTLVQGGPDRAYEASIAAKSIEADWFVPVVPSYMSVD